MNQRYQLFVLLTIFVALGTIYSFSECRVSPSQLISLRGEPEAQHEDQSTRTYMILTQLQTKLNDIERQIQDLQESSAGVTKTSVKTRGNVSPAVESKRNTEDFSIPFDTPLKITRRLAPKVPNRCEKKQKPFPSGWRKNVVFAMASSFKLARLRSFIRSCALFVKSGSCIIIRAKQDQNDAELVDYIKNQPNVFAVYEGVDLKAVEAWDSYQDVTITNQMKNLNPDVKRYLAYKALFLDYGCTFDKVFLTDSADVFFQQDPFDYVGTPGVYFASEMYKLETSVSYTAKWVNAFRDPYDLESNRQTPIVDDMVGQNSGKDCTVVPKSLTPHVSRPCIVAPKQVLCSGTTIGTSRAMEAYVDAILTLIAESTTDTHMRGIDQGFHNVLVYRYPWLLQPHQSTILDAFSSFIVTKGGCDDDFLDVPHVPGPFKLNIPAVIHQYNRCPELTKKVNEFFQKV